MNKLILTDKELEALQWLLVEESQRMNDDGREGAFEASPLEVIYKKVVKLQRIVEEKQLR